MHMIKKNNSLLFFALLVGFGVRLFISILKTLPLWYDEIIFISFSKQPFLLLLETLSAEPHPPGFFLFLKLFPVENILATRLLLLGMSYALLAIGVVYAYKTKLVDHAKLSWGLLLFLTSYSFYSATMYVRDRSISIPLAFIMLLMALNIVRDPQKYSSTRHMSMLGVLMVVVMVMSYDVFLFLIVATISIGIYVRNKSIVLMHAFVGFAGVLYTMLYGAGQLMGNADRSIWFSYVYNSLFHSFYKHIAGVLPFSFMTDIAVGIYIVLIGVGLYVQYKKKPSPVVAGIFFLMICWSILSYVLHLFPRPHYVALLYLLVSIIAGWGMIRIAHKKLQYALFVILAIVGFSAYMLDIQRTRTLYTNLPRIIGDSIEGEKEPYGLLSTAPLMPYVLKIEYFPEEKRLIPLQIMTEKHLGADSITVDHLSADTVFDSGVLTADEISRRLGVFGLQNILYYSSPFTNTYAVDYSQATLLVLAASCEERGVQKITDTQYLYTFRNCLFSQPISHAGLEEYETMLLQFPRRSQTLFLI